MLAYHNNPQLKQQILQQLQGSGWNVFIEDYKNGLGIPKTLIYLHDAINRGLSNDLAKNWPIRFISAIQVGADLSTVWREFVIWLLVDPVDGVIQYTHPGTEVYEVIIRVATLYRDGYTQKQMREAAYAAYAVYSAAYSALSAFAFNAAYYAVHDAASNIAAYSAYSAYSAAYAVSAAYGAALADYATYAVSAAAHAHAHASNAAVSAALATARNAAYIKMSNKLIELLEKQEVTC